MDGAWDAFRDELRGAVEAFVGGDPERYQRCWSSTEDCAIFGAFGGVARGSQEIHTRLGRAAAQYKHGRYMRFEPVSEVVGVDLALFAHLERIESVDQRDQVVVRERRVTHVVRKESDGWRIVHQHSDPLVEAKLPS